ncbi:heterokaryon incompatibility protein-domain-containing protein [Rhypophila decipiens]|uniref:Heterokaryon incompatibility protein-domain-containing protein n=1 Tax=Rhypophila decipiens TaxID=261697 RepID=A0AAN7B506_9PEZI|nr:heterokaryon incompatibility protein-domain-containing protein [Rhypophila decipiens]
MRLPTRLIDLGPSSEKTDHVRLIETWNLPAPLAAEPYRYIALSYRWGEGNRLLTTKATYSQRQTAIEVQAIPKTIRDAVLVTRRLGIRYLWVDALCIIQDDEQDWKKEAARMGDIYMNALCTIAAHAADHADCGFLQEALERELVVACGGKNSQAFLASKGTYARHHLDRTELSSRGWVMQERILSPRTIHFGKAGALYFETRDKVEHIEVGKESGYRPFPGLRDALGVLDKLQGEQDEAPSLSTLQVNLVPFLTRNNIGEKVTVLMSPDELVYNGWYELVTRYSACLLTENKDKLVALSGIVRKCQQVNKDRYVSGIWLHPDHFHVCLLWLGNGKEPLVTGTGAPSWSWASILGKVQYIHGLGMLEREISHIKSEVKLEAVHPGPGVDNQSDTIEGPAILELSNVVMINREKTGLRFVHFRAGVPWHYSLNKYLNLDKPARIWDIHDDDGERIGWASLDTYPGVSDEFGKPGEFIRASDEGITCFKMAVHDNDRVHTGHNRGYVVMFVVFDEAAGVWKRVGLGQITKRELFDGVEGTTVKLG